MRLSAAIAAFAFLVASGSPVTAQPLGTFRWQLQPYCNVVTINVTQQGGVYTLDGYDTQCNGPQRAPLVGLATPNLDGSIGLGLHVVTVPGGRGLQIDARISLPHASGSWTDSAGNSGTFAFGANTGGSPRPAPTIPGSAIAAGSITGAQLAPGSVGAAQINPAEIQPRVRGACAVGQTLRHINPDGTVVCVHALTTIDDGQSAVGRFTSIAIGVDGLPIISYLDQSARALRVTRCGNAACSSAELSTAADDPANAVGDFTSIAIGADGLPIVSHFDSTAQGLRVTHCGNAACSDGNISTTVDVVTNDAAGLYTSIAIGADGLPVISHAVGGLAGGALRVTHCGNVTCTSGNISTTVDPGPLVGAYSSIAIGADGLPVISHHDAANGTLRVTHCGTVTCASGNVSTTVDGPLMGTYSAIAIGSDGLPIISHHAVMGLDLRVTHCGNTSCTSGNVSTTIDDPKSVGSHTSIAVGADGLPIISHYDATAQALRITHCGNVACTSDNVSFTLDDDRTFGVGTFTSLAIGADGMPIVSHYDSTVQALRVAKCGTPTCQ